MAKSGKGKVKEQKHPFVLCLEFITGKKFNGVSGYGNVIANARAAAKSAGFEFSPGAEADSTVVAVKAVGLNEFSYLVVDKSGEVVCNPSDIDTTSYAVIQSYAVAEADKAQEPEKEPEAAEDTKPDELKA